MMKLVFGSLRTKHRDEFTGGLRSYFCNLFTKHILQVCMLVARRSLVIVESPVINLIKAIKLAAAMAGSNFKMVAFSDENDSQRTRLAAEISEAGTF